MKVNLLIDNAADVRNGYINIDPFTPDDDKERIKGDVSNLDHTVDAAEATEIVAHGILDYFASNIADAILNNWLSKLSHGGTLTVGVIDLLEVSRAIVSHSLPLEQAQDLVHGSQTKKWGDIKKSSYTLEQLVTVLKNKGLNILSKRVESYRAVVTCQRP